MLLKRVGSFSVCEITLLPSNGKVKSYISCKFYGGRSISVGQNRLNDDGDWKSSMIIIPANIYHRHTMLQAMC